MADRAERHKRILAAVAGAEVDRLLVTGKENVQYVSGFTGSHIQPNGACLVGAEDSALAVYDGLFRFERQPEVETEGFDIVVGPDPVALLLSDASGTIGFEDDIVSVAELQRWRELAPGCDFAPRGGLVEKLRAVKDRSELGALRAASALSDTVLEWLSEQSVLGRTELEMVLAIDRKMSDLGAQGRAFDTRVLTGERAAQPHGNPASIEIAPRQLVLVDFGCILDGYCSDCTRMFATGPVSQQMQEAFELVSRAQLAGLAATKAGVKGSDVDAVARGVIAEAGFGDTFGHGLGHGVGLEVHEEPTLTPRSENTLAENNVVSVEPGVYFAGSFGVRIEDLVIVTADGTELLTHFPKDLLQL